MTAIRSLCSFRPSLFYTQYSVRPYIKAKVLTVALCVLQLGLIVGAADITNFAATDWSTRAYYWGNQNADKPTISEDGLTLNLAKDVNHRAFVAWYNVKQKTGDFTVSFKINGNTGDGLLFVLQRADNTSPTTAIGGAGGKLGMGAADGASGVKNAYGIQFRTSGLEQAFTDNSGNLTKSGWTSGLAGVLGNTLTITWNSDTHILAIKGGSDAGFTKTYLYDLDAKLGDEFYFGFVASNGGDKGEATITEFSFSNVEHTTLVIVR